MNTSDNKFYTSNGYGYDSVGNMTANAAGESFVYDAENKQVKYFAADSDKVLSYNEKTKQNEYKTVVQTMVREAEAGRILSVKVEGELEALGVTGEHPFCVRIHKARDNTANESERFANRRLDSQG